MPKLPEEILKQRLENELYKCERKFKHRFNRTEQSLSSFPIELNVELVGAPGPMMRGGKISHKFNHKLVMTITNGYPYEKPWVVWQSLIYHPNIQLPDDGGKVCTNLWISRSPNAA